MASLLGTTTGGKRSTQEHGERHAQLLLHLGVPKHPLFLLGGRRGRGRRRGGRRLLPMAAAGILGSDCFLPLVPSPSAVCQQR